MTASHPDQSASQVLSCTGSDHTWTAQELIDFWYSEPMAAHWFQSTPEIDEMIRSRFEGCWRCAASGAYDHWAKSAEGGLALIIVLDQFPLNMYRGQKISWSTEQQAVRIAKEMIDAKLDEQLTPEHRMFLYMPLMHSESMADQDLAVAMYAKSGLTENVKFAKHHRSIVSRFGRFPHRNVGLGRETTQQEQDWLDSEDGFHG